MARPPIIIAWLAKPMIASLDNGRTACGITLARVGGLRCPPPHPRPRAGGRGGRNKRRRIKSLGRLLGQGNLCSCIHNNYRDCKIWTET